jgi:hypothetical protein
MFCIQCGSEIADDSAFCMTCGQRVEQAAAYPQPPAAPGGYAPVRPPAPYVAVGQAPAVGAAAKKSHAGLWVTLGVIAVLLLGCVGAAFAGVIPGVSSLMGTAKPRDLGVRYSAKDYDTGLTKLGVALDNKPALPTAGTRMVYEGSRPVDVALTTEEVSALLSMKHTPAYPVSDVQVKLGDNDRAEASGLVTYQGVKYPVYVDLTASVTGPRSVGASLSAIDVSGFGLPQQYWPQAQGTALDMVNGKLSQMSGLDIKSAEIKAGKLHFLGTVPASAKRVPAGQ